VQHESSLLTRKEGAYSIGQKMIEPFVLLHRPTAEGAHEQESIMRFQSQVILGLIIGTQLGLAPANADENARHAKAHSSSKGKVSAYTLLKKRPQRRSGFFYSHAYSPAHAERFANKSTKRYRLKRDRPRARRGNRKVSLEVYGQISSSARLRKERGLRLRTSAERTGGYSSFHGARLRVHRLGSKLQRRRF
jgi:hypothetical protein